MELSGLIVGSYDRTSNESKDSGKSEGHLTT